MRDSTIATMRMVMEADPTTTEDLRTRILKACAEVEKRRRLGTVRDAAVILRAHPRTVARYAAQGKLSVIRQSKRRLRYDLDECEVFASQGIR